VTPGAGAEGEMTEQEAQLDEGRARECIPVERVYEQLAGGVSHPSSSIVGSGPQVGKVPLTCERNRWLYGSRLASVGGLSGLEPGPNRRSSRS
jgi:hypothetical protein